MVNDVGWSSILLSEPCFDFPITDQLLIFLEPVAGFTALIVESFYTAKLCGNIPPRGCGHEDGGDDEDDGGRGNDSGFSVHLGYRSSGFRVQSAPSMAHGFNRTNERSV